MTLGSGSLLEKRYKIIQKLGQGGFGAVYKAFDSRLEVPVAVKESFFTVEEATRQFHREAKMLATLRHPHLPRVTDYFDLPDAGLYLVMDFIEGEDLLGKMQQYGGKVPEAKALKWILEVCDALTYLHTQNPPIIHRDIKPQNIIVTHNDTAVLVDFGLAKFFTAGQVTSTGARGLTPGFAPLEQYGMGTTDARTDVYSLAATLYTLLTNQVPPESIQRVIEDTLRPPSYYNKSVAKPLETAILKALSIKPSDRLPSVKEFAELAAKVIPSPVREVHKETPAPDDIFRTVKKTPGGQSVYVFGGIEFVKIPAGKFLMGSNTNDGSARPQHTVDIPYDYFMARYPVTNAQYAEYIDAIKSKHPVSDWQNKKDHPVTWISWRDAIAYCKWLDEKFKSLKIKEMQLRLPSEAEWEKAARGTDGRDYPWGNEFDQGKCNVWESRLKDTTPVGKYSPQGDSPYGCADMSGNVCEWMRSLNKPYPYKADDGREDETVDGQRALRGGSWYFHLEDARIYFRDFLFPLSGDKDFLGFRVVVFSNSLANDDDQSDASKSDGGVIKKNSRLSVVTFDQPKDMKPFKKTPGGQGIYVFDDLEFVKIPAGKFLMGSNKYYDNEKPQHTVDIPNDYFMMRFPVTNEQFADYVESIKSKHPVSEWQKKKDYPVTNVSWHDAMAYCKWLDEKLKMSNVGKLQVRLPSESEWEKAARGADFRDYPWGNEFDHEKCNTWESGIKDTTPVGKYSPQGDSPYGCADMCGNVWEWMYSLDKSYPYKADDGREDEKAGGDRSLRGGSFGSNTEMARCACRHWDDPDNHFNIMGFRVVVCSPFFSH